MYILYIDESGHHKEARYFVLAGLGVYERETHWLARKLDELQSFYFPDNLEPIEFHASALRSRDPQQVPPPFDQLGEKQRYDVLTEVYKVIEDSQAVLFGIAIEKAFLREEEPYDRAFEEMLSRFDAFLSRRFEERGSRDRGLVIISESNYRRNLETLARKLREAGTRWGGATYSRRRALLCSL